MRPVLGLVTIGQTPRSDLEAEFRRHAPDAEVRTVGALDTILAVLALVVGIGALLSVLSLLMGPFKLD